MANTYFYGSIQSIGTANLTPVATFGPVLMDQLTAVARLGTLMRRHVADAGPFPLYGRLMGWDGLQWVITTFTNEAGYSIPVDRP